jgi:hypothetical protein
MTRHRDELWHRGIEPRLAKRNTPNGGGLGLDRWVAERTPSWVHPFRRLRIRCEHRPDIHEAFLALGESLICSRTFSNAFCQGLLDQLRCAKRIVSHSWNAIRL